MPAITSSSLAVKTAYPFNLSQTVGAPSTNIQQTFVRHFGLSAIQSVTQKTVPLKEQLFDALSEFKVHFSSIAMHLSLEERDRLFRQLDNLLDADEWDDRDEAPTLGSFKTFVRLCLSKVPLMKPSIGASYDGHLIAAWVQDNNRLTIECLANDRIRWSLIFNKGTKAMECAAGESSLPRLFAILQPYGGIDWLY